MTITEDRPLSRVDEIENLRRRVRELEASVKDLERIRKLLHQEHAFKQAVIECAAEGICVCHAIDDYPYILFTEWNPRMETITGYTMEEINRLGWYQTLYTDPELRESARQRMLRMRAGEDLIFERWEITRADGHQRNIGISTSVLIDEDSQAHVLAMMQDITLEERSRRTTEARLASLEGIMPICAACKKIRDESGIWHPLEVFLKYHSEAEFSHTMCSECASELYPDFDLKPDSD